MIRRLLSWYYFLNCGLLQVNERTYEVSFYEFVRKTFHLLDSNSVWRCFFVTKKVLINTKVFCNLSNPLNLRYNKQTKFCSYILGNGQKTLLGPCKVSVHNPFEKSYYLYKIFVLNIKCFILRCLCFSHPITIKINELKFIVFYFLIRWKYPWAN